MGIFYILIGREIFAQERFKLHLSEHAAAFYIDKNTLETAHVGRKLFHFTKTFINLRQLLRHLSKTLADPTC